MAREYTCKLLELMDEGFFNPRELAEALAVWRPEDDIKEFWEVNALPYMLEEEEEELEDVA